MLILENARPVARKRHICDGCHRPIEPGTQYFRQRNIHDGDPCTYKAHEDCWRASEIVGNEIGDFSEPFPNVRDMEPEDREIVAAEDAELAARLWPSRTTPPEEGR